jgi:SsrA-binding protein
MASQGGVHFLRAGCPVVASSRDFHVSMAATKDKAKQQSGRVLSVNRKAYHNYSVLDTYQVGIVLTGTEIKSIRGGRFSINEAFARIENGEVLLYGMTISPYDPGTYNNHDPERVRKLLMRRDEIRKLIGKVQASGLTLIPLKMYFQRCWVKVELGLCQGKKQYDKRDSIKARENKREIDRAIKSRNSR